MEVRRPQRKYSFILILLTSIQFIVIVCLCTLIFKYLLNDSDNLDMPASVKIRVVLTKNFLMDGVQEKPWALQNIEDTDITTLKELAIYQVSDERVPILDIAQSIETGNITSIDQNAVLYSIDLDKENTDILFDFHHPELTNAFIDNEGSIVLILYKDNSGQYIAYEIRDIQNGQKIEGYTNVHGSWTRMVLDPSGAYSFSYETEKSLTIIVSPINPVYHVDGPDLYLATDKDQLSSISDIAGDQYGDYLAVAFQNGKIIIGNIEWGDFLDGGLKINDLFVENSIKGSRDLFFSYNNQYLVWLTEDEVAVWLLHEQTAKLNLREKISDGNVAAIDQYGHWLVIGTDNSLIFYDLEEQFTSYAENGELPISLPTRIVETSNSVRSIIFSMDNTMLIWGDDEGQIHIWGAIEE